MQPNTLARTFDDNPEIPVVVGLAVSTFIIIILNAEEVYEKVQLVNTIDKTTSKTFVNSFFLYS